MPEAEREAYLKDLAERDPERAARLNERLDDARIDMAEHGFCRSHGDLLTEHGTHGQFESIRRTGHPHAFAA